MPPSASTRRSLFPWLAGGAITLLAVGLVASFVGSVPPEEAASLPTGPAPPCPFGFTDRPGHAARLRARLRSTEPGAALLDALGESELRYCFGDRDVPVVSEGQLLLLDEDADDDALAARVGHLLHHVVRGMPFPDEVPADADCEALVDTAIAREAEAHALEVELRRALGVEAARYEFEADYFAAPEAERVAVVADYLRAHPDGAPNLDGLVSAYRRRCEVERAENR